jgi:MoaA/NifB/PqqE/SkfB family radical SAM enzyme
LSSISQFAKRAIAGKPLLSGWLYQPYADYLFKKKRGHLAASYRELLQGDPMAGAGTAFSIGHEPTILCNLACKMCYQGNFREDEGGVKELTLDQMIAVYDRVNVADAKLVGSEIFMRKDIYDLLDYLWKRKIPTSLMTNGTLLDEDGIEKLRKYDNIEWIGFSVDGSREIHNSIRRRPYAFDRTIKTIGQTLPHFTVSVNSVILRENLDDLASILQQCKELGIPFVHYIFEEAYTQAQVQKTHQILQREMGWEPDGYEICTNVRDEFEYSFEELVSAVEKLKREGRRLGVYPVFSPDVWSRRLSDYYYGTAAKNLHLVCAKLVSGSPTFRLDHLGNVHHCGVIRRPFGNLLEQPMEEIWNSEEYRRYRKLLMGKSLLPICTRCCKAAYL